MMMNSAATDQAVVDHLDERALGALRVEGEDAERMKPSWATDE